MANLVFYMEYGPLLSRVLKSAFLIYMYYDKLQTEKGIVQITYNDLNEHLGLASSTITKSNALLKKLELIEEIDCPQGKKYKLLPVKKLTPELQSTILRATKVEQYSKDTNLRRHYLEDDIPPEYQQMLNKKALTAAYKQIGSLKKIKELCTYFKVDYYTFKLLFERDGEDSFKAKFKKLAAEIEKPKVEKVKVPIGADDRALAAHLYEHLKAFGATPKGQWFVRNAKMAQHILTEITLEEAKAAIDWGFTNEWWQTKMTSLKLMDQLYMQYRLSTKHVIKISRSTPIPIEIQTQIAEIAKDIQVSTYEDAVFLKQIVLEGDGNKDITKVVAILEQAGIIPSGDDNLQFG